MPNPVISVQDSTTGRSTAVKGTNGAAHVTSPALIYKTASAGGYTYYGQAVSGTATSDALWQIARKDDSDGTTILYARSGAFTAVWDNRATSETYA